MDFITTAEGAAAAVAARSYWHHAFEIYPGLMTPGAYNPNDLFGMLGLGADVKGKRVLDVGAANGFFSRELHRLGADVVAFDQVSKATAGFDVMEACYGQRIAHVQGNLAGIRELGLGEFDIVICLGVLYHLPDPVRALWDLRSMCRERLFVESFVEFFDEKPAARYYAGASMNGWDDTNFWGFNPACIKSMLEDVGVAIQREVIHGDRVLFEGTPHAGTAKMQRAYALLP